MSVAPRIRMLSGAWQVPLLAASVAMLIAGLLRLRPAVPEVSFEEYVQYVHADLEAHRFDRASQILAALIDSQTLTQPQRAAAYRLLAETIWRAESVRPDHDPENARRIIANYARSVNLGLEVDAADKIKLAQASDWRSDAANAIELYQQALAEPSTDRLPVLERLIELLLEQPQRDWPQIDARIDELIAAATGEPDMLLRGVQWKVQRLLDNDRIDDARSLIASVEARLDVPPWSHHLQYFQSLILFREDQYGPAEARLRALQAGLRRSNPLYAQAGWLLGQINYIEGRPDEALAIYEEVIRAHAGSEYWLASLVGKAESLAAMERYGSSAQCYRQAIDALRTFQGSLVLDRQAIRTSLQTMAVTLWRMSRPREALPFAQIGLTLAEAMNDSTLADLVELEARIHVQAAEAYLSEAGRGETAGAGTPSAGESMAGATAPVLAAREHYGKAGEQFLRLAKLKVLHEPVADEASWQAAICFDKAGQIEQAIEVLQQYVEQRPRTEHTPDALHRLGQALQASGRIDEAITAYEDLLAKFGRTPAAFASLVPLARCYLAHGPKRFDTVEGILLSVVEEDPTRPALFTPAAPEFRASLIELANLYMRWEKPERAIERLEQAILLYPDDPETSRLQYQLADAYRRSGLALRDEAARMSQPGQGDGLLVEARRRIARAKDLFDQVASRLDLVTGRLSPGDQVALQNSYVYRADCAFDVAQYVEAADLYGRVAWRWQDEPLALAAYVQIVRCYLAVGDLEAARSALARANWILRKIPDSQFNRPPDHRSREYWEDLFAWMEQSGLVPTARPAAMAGAN